MPTYRHFVGRDAERDRFRQVLADPAGQAVLIVGPQGMGKTTLADRFLEVAREEPWTVVVRDLPPKIKLLFAQRPDDVLASSFEFGRLDNVVRIPDGPLDTLDPDAVEKLIDLCQSGTSYSTGELSTHLAAAKGHPYVVAGSLDLLLEGSRLDDLPSDPGRIAEEQWKKVCDLEEAAPGEGEGGE